MATLISVHNSEGLVGRCDEKCYKAQYPKCDCVCGGRNHGVGFKKAIEQTQQIRQEVLEKYAKDRVVFPDGVKQLEMAL